MKEEVAITRVIESNWVSTVKSIHHWKEMIERMKWLAESGFPYERKVDDHWKLVWDESLPVILNTNWSGQNCALCRTRVGCTGCPLQEIDLNCNKTNSPWKLTAHTFSLPDFIENAERYMIPALYQAKKWCEEQGEI